MMRCLIRAMQQGEHCLIESPTGTGKTLVLLCTTLAWKEQYENWMRTSKRHQRNVEKSTLEQLQQLHKQTFGQLQFDIKQENDKQRPKIYFASRTHSQLSQCIKEMENTGFKSKVRVLGSRDQLCIHPEVKKVNAGVRTALCKAKVSKSLCEYQKRAFDRHVQQQMDQVIMDIEDLVLFGNKHHCCPFYLEKETQADADIIFLPYNYLIDRTARDSLSINLNNAIVIFDEAHNLESFCCESASFELSTLVIGDAVLEARRCASLAKPGESRFDYTFYTQLADRLQTLVDFLFKMHFINNPKTNTVEIIKQGPYIFELLEMIGITLETLDLYKAAFDEAQRLLQQDKQMGRLGLSELRSCCMTAFLSRKPATDDIYKYYKVHVVKQSKIVEDKKSVTEKQECVLSLLCFTSSIAMNDLQDARTLIMASGTLSPLDQFSVEMGVHFKHQLENTHVIHPKQVLVSVVTHGPSGNILISNYQNGMKPEYVRDLGLTILQSIAIIPDGVLVFFQSYRAMENAMREWKYVLALTIEEKWI
ncbi:hypothetical protein EDD86DRAFT_212872 [Gorgonomyces haynaldii]|nr:hypothetical protein EDD86DRAFT_212872 [Gorgonomyces haynaldii]